jgi:biopolymer transport protein ExbD
MRRHGKRALDFELNLLPFISVLAVCISFLLLTSVWTKVGTFNLNQAFGTDGAGQVKNPPSLWVKMENDGTLEMKVNEMDSLPARLKLTHINAQNALAVESYARALKAAAPQIDVALILPAADSTYDNIVAIMDRLKKQNFNQIGIAPL